MMNRKKIFFILLATLSIASCGGGSSEPDPGPQPKTFSVSLGSIGITQVSDASAIIVDTTSIESGDLTYTQ